MKLDDILDSGNKLANTALLVPIGLIVGLFYTKEKGFTLPDREGFIQKSISILLLVFISIFYLLIWGNLSKSINILNDYNNACRKMIENRELDKQERDILKSEMLKLEPTIKKIPEKIKEKYLYEPVEHCNP